MREAGTSVQTVRAFLSIVLLINQVLFLPLACAQSAPVPAGGGGLDISGSGAGSGAAPVPA